VEAIGQMSAVIKNLKSRRRRFIYTAGACISTIVIGIVLLLLFVFWATRHIDAKCLDVSSGQHKTIIEQSLGPFIFGRTATLNDIASAYRELIPSHHIALTEEICEYAVFGFGGLAFHVLYNSDSEAILVIPTYE
jgi:hypothetical protein